MSLVVRFLRVVIFGLMKACVQDRSPNLPECKACIGCEPGAPENLYVKPGKEANMAEGRVN